MRVLDLHGNMKKKETAADGGADENVFEIQQGVCILLALSSRAALQTRTWYSGISGARDTKYSFLIKASMTATDWEEVSPTARFYLLRPEDTSVAKEYAVFVPLPKVMSLNGDPAPGIVTTHDDFAISWSKDEAVNKVLTLLNTKGEADARRLFRLCGQAQWNYERAKAELPKQDWQDQSGIILYRPFDPRWTIYNAHVAVHRRLRATKHFLGTSNIGLCVGKAGQVVGSGQWNLVSCTRYPVDFNYFYRGGACNFPLHLLSDEEGLAFGKQNRVNISREYLDAQGLALSGESSNEKSLLEGFNAEKVLHHMYALLHSPSYRSRYAEFLKIDFPCLPRTSSQKLFRELARLGGELNRPGFAGDSII